MSDHPRLMGADLDVAIFERVLGGRINCSHGAQCSDIPPFSTDIAAAWLVAEKLREIGLEIIVASESDGWETEVTVTEALHQQGYRGCYAKAASAAESISRAALRAFDTAPIPQPVALAAPTDMPATWSGPFTADD
jgi:hypothetical protein